ncbi:hypothetical protein M9Y10_033382 [Tritrichomonas musculus]|uniref:Uncharacterized protein n=1 Tax=Tritrichomonas musculus TaxID=1915356 RepID=A0ABR2KF80_9EUKA
MKYALLFSFFFTLSLSDCEMVYGLRFNTTFDRSSISNYCFNVISSIFVSCMSETSGGAISIHCSKSYGVVHECTFVYCQSKVQGACIYFSGNRIETFRNCVLNCTSRFNAMFLSSQLAVSGGEATIVDMLTVFGSSSQTNAVSHKNGDVLITNFNLTKSKASASILAMEINDAEDTDVSYFTFVNNTGNAKSNSIIYIHNDICESTKYVHHGNLIKNTCLNGGYLFSFIDDGAISDCIFKDNSRSVLTAFRYYVTFISCVFDGSEAHTEFLTYQSCQFLTETATMHFTFIECPDKAPDLKLNLVKDKEQNQIISLSTTGYTLVVIGIVALLAIIITILVKAKKNRENVVDDDNIIPIKNEEQNNLSTTPLIQ